VLGGDLNIRFETQDDIHFTNIFLEGPAVQVFEGEVGI
jgi:diaminopimelate epimerase